ncbi:MAG: hypothetical protein QME64_12200 [bacterium]|nr:hypothetical protein [bacterium]
MIIKLYHLDKPVVNIVLQFEPYDYILPKRTATAAKRNSFHCPRCCACFSPRVHRTCPRCGNPKKYWGKGSMTYGKIRKFYGDKLNKLWGKRLIAVPVSLEIYSISGNGSYKDRDDDQIGNLAFGLVSEHLIVDDHLIWKHSVTKLFSKDKYPKVSIYLDFHEPNFLASNKSQTPEYYAAMDTLTKYHPGQRLYVPKQFANKLDSFNQELRKILYAEFENIKCAGSEHKHLFTAIRDNLPNLVGVRNRVILDMYREYRNLQKEKPRPQAHPQEALTLT